MRAPVLSPLAAAVLCALFPPLVSSDAPSIDPRLSSSNPLAPSPEATRRNAFKIFNAVHSAARQWGSSLDHNGMSFFLATVPEGNVFFHGASTPDRPEGMEWLAFEIEHSQVFARSADPDEEEVSSPAGGKQEPARGASWHDLFRYEGHGSKSLLTGAAPRPAIPKDQQQHPMALSDGRVSNNDSGGDGGRPRPPRRSGPGYFQTYRAQRQLNLLYIDGMAAGKCPYGPLDTQDYVLLDWDVEEGERRKPGFGWSIELARAHQLCDVVAKKWEDAGTPIDGFVRMEAGFEIIYCHFEDGGGLERIAVDASPYKNQTGWVDWEASSFEWLRACSLRYNGFPAERITIDWSSMVSAFFYDVNLTNPDPRRPELPRVVNTTRWQRQAIKQRVDEVLEERHPAKRYGQTPQPNINWQGVVDSIVTRYSDRLAALASGTLSASESHSMINSLLLPFTSTASPTPYRPSLERCSSLYLEPALAHNGTSSWTAQDEFISAAVGTVSRRICQVLIDAWVALSTSSQQQRQQQQEGEEEGKMMAVSVDKSMAQLVGQLGWSTWRECGRCASPLEICFVAMFPFGTPEDHYAPRCKNASELGWDTGTNYWLGPVDGAGGSSAMSGE
ncbi:hypothetical protein MAPG_06216 [Magnaporthiopsis poae ATCC 64411]|uniref:Uncharacterized protein n=1 Tax=Magnaporthiopsis poae (strain ATCC 64411 / 73-15) TaxID=644358 RepID=A0A0C4E1F6_MAGP6|nr:hypothetical protein MAPG_06216 [Magnaporthiopsis poae ATCC 64411]